jgi:hypothetical protein
MNGGLKMHKKIEQNNKNKDFYLILSIKKNPQLLKQISKKISMNTNRSMDIILILQMSLIW